MNRLILCAALVSLAACQQQETAPPVQNDATTETAAIPATVPSLDGKWRVTAINGGDAAAIGMTATLGSGNATLSTGCFRRGWTYTQDRNTVAFKTAPSGSSNCGGQAPGATEEGAFAALADANIAIFAKDGKEATLSGTGGTLTMERS